MQIQEIKTYTDEDKGQEGMNWKRIEEEERTCRGADQKD